MYTITINNDDPIICKDYGIHNHNGQKTLYMSFTDQADIGIKLDDKDNVEVIYKDQEGN